MAYVDAKEVLEQLGISRTTLYRLTQEGMPYYKVNEKRKLYDIGVVKDFVERRQDSLSMNLTVGKFYTNREIADLFRCSTQGGMRKSNTKNALVLTSEQSDPDRLYQDYWKDGVLYYTGEGQTGEQKLNRNNRTLAESPANGVNVYLFECFGENTYRYRGVVERCGKPYQEEEKDSVGDVRKVWKFPLKPIDDTDSLDETFFEDHEAALKKRADRMQPDKVRKLAEEMDQVPSERIVTSKQKVRNPVLARFAKMRANGKCELCGQPAPFKDCDGKPYLEEHHLVPVAEDGKDNKNNVCALCPNCHRRMHVVKDPKDIEKIRENMRKDQEALDSRN